MGIFQQPASRSLWYGILLLWLAGCAQARGLPLQHIQLPPGFTISVYAENLPDARSMALSPEGVLFVGSRHAGKVYAVLDRNKDGKADEVVTIASGLFMPNGVAFRNGSLYVAEVNRILRFDDIVTRLRQPPEPVTITDALPSETHHGWRYLRFGADGMLYVAVGAPCNACLDPGYAEIKRLHADGSGLETYALGVRNSVGFDWDPVTGDLWFTDNGRDWLGDDRPPDELNRAPRKGMHFGYPFCHGRDIPDPEFGKSRKCREFSPPELGLGAHVAALGMRFYTGRMFPEKFRNQIFIAEHGSWNRSTKVGYRIVRVRLEGGKPVESASFAQGWLQGDAAWGRPVDVLVAPDGSLLVSDDRTGAVYRIRYTAPEERSD